jgi:hypothetical protein
MELTIEILLKCLDAMRETLQKELGSTATKTIEYKKVPEGEIPKGARSVLVRLKGKSPKAYLLEYNNKEAWVPLSTIHTVLDDYVEGKWEQLVIDGWVLDKKFKEETK